MATGVAVERKRAGQRLPFRKRRQTDGLKSAVIWLLLVGAVSLAIWYFTNDGSMMSMLLALASISTITLSVLLFFLSPSRSVRSDVCDAMAISGTLEIRKILSALHAELKGIYIPAIDSGQINVFVPLTGSTSQEILSSLSLEEGTFLMSKDGVTGVLLTPPGYGLFLYARRIGARFSGVNLEDEIGDVIVDSLELADSVSVNAEGDRIRVTLKNITDYELCKSIRKEDPAICCQTGCPICSAVGCMIADSTGRMTSIESVRVNGKTLDVEYRLIGE